MRISENEPSTLAETWAGMREDIALSKSMEAAAQRWVVGLSEAFSPTITLARVFATAPYGRLPAREASFARRLSEEAGVDALLTDATPVLVLVGSYGQEAQWRDRRDSEGHLAIPLVSESFVDEIPMLSRLLKDLGLPMSWVSHQDEGMLRSTLGKASGLFYVEDARSAKDDRGRHIIANEAFVSRYEIQSVFGVGGAYFGGTVLVAIVFCTEHLPAAKARNFLPMVSYFKSLTGNVCSPARLFDQS